MRQILKIQRYTGSVTILLNQVLRIDCQYFRRNNIRVRAKMTAPMHLVGFPLIILGQLNLKFETKL